MVKIDEAMRAQLLEAIRPSYIEQQDIRYGAARGWLDQSSIPSRPIRARHGPSGRGGRRYVGQFKTGC